MPNSWQKWEVDYTVGDPTYTLTIDGNSASGLKADDNGGNGLAATVDGLWLHSGSGASVFYVDDLLVTMTVEPPPGDLDGDGFVGVLDQDILINFWGQSVTPGDLLSGDPSGDGFVGGDDFDIVRFNWGSGTPPSSALASASPEPGSLTLATLGGLVFLAFRRLRRV